MSLTKLSLGGNNDAIHKLFPPKESLVSDIPAGDGNIEKLFLGCACLCCEQKKTLLGYFVPKEFFNIVLASLH